MTAAPGDRQTHVYKTIDGCAIKADVFGADGRAGRPAVIWVHGGGLIFGSRTRPRQALLAALLQAGAVVVSIDHRLAPETPLAEIAGDVQDALAWAATQGPALFGIDPARIAMAGASAGGYLTLMMGHRASEHRPRALLSMFGFGDITLPWEAEPSAHYLETMPLMTRERVLLTVGTQAVSEGTEGIDRSEFYLYCRQQGCWLAEVTKHDPATDPRWFDAYCPLRNLAPGFPPTLLVHGTADTDVPCSESEALAARMAGLGIAHEFMRLEGLGHGLAGATPQQVARIEGHAAAFLMARLG